MAVVDLILTVSGGLRVSQIGVLILLGLHSTELFRVNDWFKLVRPQFTFALLLLDLLVR